MADDLEFTGPRYATSDYTIYAANPFENAVQVTTYTQDLVTEQLEYIRDSILGPSSFGAIGKLNEQLQNLANFSVAIPNDIQFLKPDLNTSLTLNMDLSDIDPSTFGQISPFNPGNAPTAGDLPTIDDVVIESFTPSITGITVPPAPGPITVPDPGDAPESPGFTYPEFTGDLTLPDAPSLLGINIPNPPDIDLPTLDLGDFPTPPTLDIDTLIPWTEPAYTPEIWADVKAQLLTFLAGGTGIRPDVEEAIVNRGRDREDRIVRQQVQQATEEWANRGFTAPPGLLAKYLNNIREEGTLKKLGLQREVVIKAMEEELTNLRFACQQGIAAEQLFVQIHLAAVERLFLIQRLHIEYQIQVYNLAIQIFQARLQENVIRAQIYEVQVRAALAEIEVFKALIEAERAKSEVNKVLIESYKAEIEARQTIVNLYIAQVEAVKVQAEVFETEVRAYGEEVQAFATRVAADKTRFDAYETQVRGELAKANIIEAEARAYQAEVQGIGEGVRAQVAALEGEVSKFRANIEAYDARIRGYVALNQNELANIQANVEGHRLNTQRFVAEAGVEEAAERLRLTAWEAENRIEVETFRADIERLNVLMEKALKEADLMLTAVRSSAELASTISAGALAAMHVGATTQGSGSVNSSGSDSVSYAESMSRSQSCNNDTSVNISYESDTLPGIICPFE